MKTMKKILLFLFVLMLGISVSAQKFSSEINDYSSEISRMVYPTDTTQRTGDTIGWYSINAGHCVCPRIVGDTMILTSRVSDTLIYRKHEMLVDADWLDNNGSWVDSSVRTNVANPYTTFTPPDNIWKSNSLILYNLDMTRDTSYEVMVVDTQNVYPNSAGEPFNGLPVVFITEIEGHLFGPTGILNPGNYTDLIQSMLVGVMNTDSAKMDSYGMVSIYAGGVIILPPAQATFVDYPNYPDSGSIYIEIFGGALYVKSDSLVVSGGVTTLYNPTTIIQALAADSVPNNLLGPSWTEWSNNPETAKLAYQRLVMATIIFHDGTAKSWVTKARSAGQFKRYFQNPAMKLLDPVSADFFGRGIQKHKRLVIRSGGSNELYEFITDAVFDNALAQSYGLMHGGIIMNDLVQHHRYVVLFINGEFFGINEITEDYDPKTAGKYNPEVKASKTSMFTVNEDTTMGFPILLSKMPSEAIPEKIVAKLEPIKRLIQASRQAETAGLGSTLKMGGVNAPTDTAASMTLLSAMTCDPDSIGGYIDIWPTMVATFASRFPGCLDYAGAKNFPLFAVKLKDGSVKVYPHYGDGDVIPWFNPSDSSFYKLKHGLDGNPGYNRQWFMTNLFNKILDSDTLQSQFLNMSACFMATTYSKDSLLNYINMYVDTISPLLTAHYDAHGNNSIPSDWLSNKVSTMRNFAETRHGYVYGDLINTVGGIDTFALTVNVDTVGVKSSCSSGDLQGGYVQFNNRMLFIGISQDLPSLNGKFFYSTDSTKPLTINMLAAPWSGWKFDYWVTSGGDTMTDQEINFTSSVATTITAIFSPDTSYYKCLGGIVFSEVKSQPTPLVDSVELTNSKSWPIFLGNYFMSDQMKSTRPGALPKKKDLHQLPNVWLEPGEVLVIQANDYFGGDDPYQAPFKVNSTDPAGDDLHMWYGSEYSNLIRVDNIVVPSMSSGSYQRCVDTAGIEYYRYSSVDDINFPNSCVEARIANTITEQEVKSGLNVFPNPISHGQLLTIQILDDDGNIARNLGASIIKIIDNTGREIVSKDMISSLTQYDITPPSVAGIYHISVITSNRVRSATFVVVD